MQNNASKPSVTMGETNSQKWANWATLGGLIVAVVAGVTGCIQGCEGLRRAKLADEKSQKALEQAELAMKIERALIAPYIKVLPQESKVELFNEQHLKDADIGLMVHNIDSQSIDMVRMQVFVVSLKRDQQLLKVGDGDGGWYCEVDCNFREVVRSDILAKADLKKALLEQLLKLELDLENHKDSVISVRFHIVCDARFYGTSKPIGVGTGEVIDSKRIVSPYEVKNREFITLLWKPAGLPRDTIAEYGKNYTASPWVGN